MCTRPLYAYRDRVLSPSGEYSFQFNPVDCKVDKRLHFLSYDAYQLMRSDADLNSSIDHSIEYLQVPCGQCIECRLDYSRQWATRIMCETKLHKYNYFLTLTYDDDHLPLNKQNLCTLDFKDLTKFIKDYRRFFDYHFSVTGIRYYACGEYGSLGGRPHFHIAVFQDYPLDDLEYLKTNSNGDLIFNSAIVSNIWKKGLVSVGGISFQSASYVARYMLKKQKGATASVYSQFDLVPEAARMSRKPGIGAAYYEAHKDDIYKNDELIFPKVGKVKPPRYFDSLYDLDYPERMGELKLSRREAAEISTTLMLNNTDLNLDEINQIKDRLVKNKVKQLSNRNVDNL